MLADTVGSKWGTKIETHGPYQHGGGYPSVNGVQSGGAFPTNIPFNVTKAPVGITQDNVFASEFGCSVYSSFESMAPTLATEHWGVHGGAVPDNCTGGFSSVCEGNNTIAQRNYVCDNIIQTFFGAQGATKDLNAVGEHAFKAQLWQCMVGQALNIKQNIEARRAESQFGCLVWQLNEVWPTGGWGSIEYGTVGFTKGQVRGGRWKPLHYWCVELQVLPVLTALPYVDRTHLPTRAHTHSRERARTPHLPNRQVPRVDLRGCDGNVRNPTRWNVAVLRPERSRRASVQRHRHDERVRLQGRG